MNGDGERLRAAAEDLELDGEAIVDWSLTSLQLKLIKIDARVVRHARSITFQLAEVAVTGLTVRVILAAIQGLCAPPSCV